MNSSVLIISDDAEFSRAVTGRWQCERHLPSVTLMSSDLCCGEGSRTGNFDAAIVGGVDSSRLSAVLSALYDCGKPMLLVCERGSTQVVSEAYPRVLAIRQCEGWAETAVLVMTETLRRSQAIDRVQQLESAKSALEREATLGRYLLDMRHALNNALTSALGNSELLLQEPRTLSAEARLQLETVRNMSLRIYEILQRFSSLEKELSLVESQEERPAKNKQHRAAAGS